MAKRITGIRELRGRIEDIVTKLGSIDDGLAKIPQNKIVLVDYAWDLTNCVMPATSYLSPECEQLAQHRTVSRPHPETGREENPYLVPKAYYGFNHETKDYPLCGHTNASLHGTACAAVLSINHEFVTCFDKRDADSPDDMQKDKEGDLWNLCPETSVVLCPVREFAPIDRSRFQSTFDGCMARATTGSIDQLLGHLASDLFGNIGKDVGDIWGGIVERAIRGALDRNQFVQNAVDEVSKLLSEVEITVNGHSTDDRDDATTALALVQLLTELSLPLFDEFGIAATLSTLLDAAGRNELGRGDVIVLPIEFRAKFEVHPDANKASSGKAVSKFFDNVPAEITKLPIIILPEVEAAIKALTSNGISVVISAGNVRTNLSKLDLKQAFSNAMCGTIHENREDIFKTFGVSCGAIMVGATDLQQKQNWLDPVHNHASKNVGEFEAENAERMRNSHGNHGICVDAFGRGAANTVAGYCYELDTKVSKDLYAHWCGASIAAVVTAASLATLQQYRMAIAELEKTLDGGEQKSIKPLKPIEARSHFRVFRSQLCNEYPCRTELMGPPPDVIAILEGANLEHPG